MGRGKEAKRRIALCKVRKRKEVLVERKEDLQESKKERREEGREGKNRGKYTKGRKGKLQS